MNLDPYSIVISLPVIILALTVHEYAHAAAADRLGDPTARYAGRLTLDPWVHLDPIGMLALIFARFGWAKPVPVNPNNMKDPSRGFMLTALAGPLANVAMAAAFGLLLGTGAARLAGQAFAVHLERMFWAGLTINSILAMFNLLPVPPLDGSRVFAYIAPVQRWPWWVTIETYGPIILVLLVFSGAAMAVIGPPASGLASAMLRAGVGLARLIGLR
jgi:Zn-dependent protease